MILNCPNDFLLVNNTLVDTKELVFSIKTPSSIESFKVTDVEESLLCFNNY